MRSQFSVSIFHHSNCSHKIFSFSRTTFAFGCFAALTALVLTGYFFFQSRTLAQTVFKSPALKQGITHQRQRIDTREQQIALLEERLHKLNTKVTQLKAVEEKIQDIARIKPAINHDNLFGIGGTRDKPANQEQSVTQPVAIDTEISLGSIVNQPPADQYIPRQISNHPAGFTLVFEPTDFSINPITGIPSLLPVSQNFKNRFPANYPEEIGIMECRRGISLSVQEDSYIVVPSNGVAAYAGRSSSYEKILVIDHGHGFISRYIGLDRISIKTGERVRRGDRIGFIKATRQTETPNYLYYEILLNGLPVSPAKYLSRSPFLL